MGCKCKNPVNNIVNIIQGYSNLISKKETVLMSAIEKSKFCVNCKFITDVSLYKIIKDREIPAIEGKACKLCGCNLSAKLRSNSKCPLNNF